jgi:hypothetical protein
MPNYDKYREKYMMALEPHVEGEVRAVGVFSRAGSMGSMGLSYISPLAASIKRATDKGRSGGLPQNFVVGVTDDKVYVFGYKPRGTSIKVKAPLAVWNRGDIRMTHVDSGTMANTIQVDIAGQEPILIESNKMPGSKTDFNGPVLEALSAA